MRKQNKLTKGQIKNRLFKDKTPEVLCIPTCVDKWARWPSMTSSNIDTCLSYPATSVRVSLSHILTLANLYIHCKIWWTLLENESVFISLLLHYTFMEFAIMESYGIEYFMGKLHWHMQVRYGYGIKVKDQGSRDELSLRCLWYRQWMGRVRKVQEWIYYTSKVISYNYSR